MDPEVDAEILAQLLMFAEQTTDFVGVADPWGRILYLNPAARKRLGVADATDLTVADVFPPEAFALYHEIVRPQLLRSGVWSGEIPVIVAGGDAIPMRVTTTVEIGPGGGINGSVVYAQELAHVDPVVSTRGSEPAEVLDRSTFRDRVRDALAVASRDREDCALVLTTWSMADTIDTFDQLVAANVARALAGRMLRIARAIDIVGQLGEHQLGLFCRGVRSQGEALRIARTVSEALTAAPVTIPGGAIAPLVGCGVALAKPGDDLVDLIRRASATIWHEPATRDDDAFDARSLITDRSDRSDQSDQSDESAGMDEFRVGMTCGDVRAYAQPVVDFASGHVVGYRGLARWHHRHLGVLNAAMFVDMIADTPLASQVDLCVARETAAVLTLTTRKDERLRLYTPVSRRLVADVRTEQYLTEIADAFSLTMSQLRLQVARPLLDHWTPSLQNALRSLRELGSTLVLTGGDDVSDADRLAEHGFDELHLSRRLTNAAAAEPDARKSAIDLVRRAHGLGLLVAASGVNNDEHRAALVDLGCDLASGDLYGAPMPTDAIE